MGRKLFVWILIAATLATAGVSAWRHPTLRAQLHQTTVDLISKALGTPLRYEQINTQLFPPAITIYNLQLTANQDWPALAIRKLYVEPALWPSSTGRPMVRHLWVEGLRLHLQTESPSHPKPPIQPIQDEHPWPFETHLSELLRKLRPYKTLPRLPFDILNITFKDGQWLWERPEASYQSANVNCRLQAHPQHMRQLQCRCPDNTITMEHNPWSPTDLPIPWTLTLTVQLQGSLDEASHLVGAQLQWALPGLHTHAQMDWQEQQLMPVALAFFGRIQPMAYEVFTPLPTLLPTAGQFLLMGRLGQGTHPSLQVTALLEPDAAHSDRGMPPTQCQARWHKQQVQLQRCRCWLKQQQQLNLSGQLGLTPHLPLTLQLESQRLDLPALLAVFDSGPLPFQLQLAGDIQIQGTLMPFQLAGPAQLDLQQFRLPKDLQIAPWIAIPKATLVGQLTLNPQGLGVQEGLFTMGSTQFAGHGWFPWQSKEAMALTLESQQLSLLDVQQPFQLDLQGTGSATLQLQGPYEALELTGELALEELVLAQQTLGQLSGRMRYNNTRLAFEQLNIRTPQASLQGAFQLTQCGEQQRCIAASLDSYRFPLQSLLHLVPLPQQMLQHLQGRLTGRIVLDGPLERPTGQLQLTLYQVSYGDQLLGDIDVDGVATLDEQQPFAERLSIASRAWSQQTQWQLVWQRSFHQQGALLTLQFQQIPAHLMALVVKGSKSTGLLSGHWRSEGIWPHMKGSGVLRGQDITYQQWLLGNSQTHLSLENTQLTGETHLRTLGLTTTWQIDLVEHGQAHIDGQCHRTSSEALSPTPMALAAVWSGNFHFHGPLDQPQAWQGWLKLQEATLSYAQVPMALRQPVLWQLEQGMIRLEPSSFGNQELGMTLAGAVSWQGTLQLELEAQGDVAAIRTWLPGVIQAKGPFQLKLLGKGSLQQPSWQGRMGLQHATMRLEHTDAPLEQITIDVQLQERTLRLQQAQAKVGHGQLQLLGDVIWPVGNQAPQLNLRGQLQRLPLRPLQDCDALVTGDVTLSGSSPDLQLTGQLHLDEVHYTARVDLEKILRQRKAPPLRVPSTQQAIGLNIRLEGNNNIFLSNSMLNTELQVQLQITGRTDRIGLVGTVRPLWGTGIYRNNKFMLQRGHIDFLDPFQLRSNYQFVVHIDEQNCKIRAEVQISGTTDSYTITTTGTDNRGAVSTTDVLSCLQFGVRSSTFRDTPNQTGRDNFFNESLASGVGALWAMSGLDERINRLLPFQLQELRLSSGPSVLTNRYGLRLIMGKDILPSLRARINSSLDNQNDVIINLEYKLKPNASLESTLQPKLYYAYDLGLDMRLHWDMR